MVKLEEIETMLRTQAENLNIILTNLTSKDDVIAGTAYEFPKDYFPMRTTDALINFENLLVQNDGAEMKLVM